MASLPPANPRRAAFAFARNNPAWLMLYRSALAMIAAYGLFAFIYVDGPHEVWFEAAFFMALFPVLLWPLFLRD